MHEVLKNVREGVGGGGIQSTMNITLLQKGPKQLGTMKEKVVYEVTGPTGANAKATSFGSQNQIPYVFPFGGQQGPTPKPSTPAAKVEFLMFFPFGGQRGPTEANGGHQLRRTKSNSLCVSLWETTGSNGGQRQSHQLRRPKSNYLCFSLWGPTGANAKAADSGGPNQIPYVFP